MLGSYLGWLDIEVPLVFVIGIFIVAVICFYAERKRRTVDNSGRPDLDAFGVCRRQWAGSCSDAFILDAISICCGSGCTGKIFPSGTCGWFACSSDKTDMCIRKCRSICCYVDGVLQMYVITAIFRAVNNV